MKCITIHTNYNNKLSQNTFIHIDLAPATPIPESVIKSSVFIIKCEDNSHPPVTCSITDIRRMPLSQLSENLIKESHNMPGISFILEFLRKNYLLISKKNLTMQTIQVAVYYYQKIQSEVKTHAQTHSQLITV